MQNHSVKENAMSNPKQLSLANEKKTTILSYPQKVQKKELSSKYGESTTSYCLLVCYTPT